MGHNNCVHIPDAPLAFPAFTSEPITFQYFVNPLFSKYIVLTIKEGKKQRKPKKKKTYRENNNKFKSNSILCTYNEIHSIITFSCFTDHLHVKAFLKF